MDGVPGQTEARRRFLRMLVASPIFAGSHFFGRSVRDPSRMEKRTGTEEPFSLSESTRFQQADRKRPEGLADYTQEGRRFVFPDLQSAPCVLHATELGCSRCSCATRHAS